MDNAETIALTFRRARTNGWALASFPLAVPDTLAEAYAIQRRELAALGDELAGWKVAMIKPELRSRYGAARIFGPIVRLLDARGAADRSVEAEVIPGGFAAIEAEFAFRIGADLPPRPAACAPDEVLAAVASLHVAAELAGSPLSSLSDLGPAAVVADHGNNAAIIVGDEIADWRRRPLDTLTSRTSVDGAVVGEGSAERVPGGPLGSLADLVDHLHRRGLGLRRGDWVSTGATTGVHRLAPGAVATLDFGAAGTITVRVAAQPELSR